MIVKLVQPKRHRFTVGPAEEVVQKLKRLKEPADLFVYSTNENVGGAWKNEGRWVWTYRLDIMENVK